MKAEFYMDLESDVITLYHGTSAKAVKKIIEDQELKPRAGRKSIWDGEFPSAKDRVYLTSCYPMFFAASAHYKTKSEPMILEIKIPKNDQEFLMPDEDPLGQLENIPKKHKTYGMSFKQRTKWWKNNAPRYPHLWRDSLRLLGTCAYYGSISLISQTGGDFGISRIIEMPENYLYEFDPSISLANHQTLGHNYHIVAKTMVESCGDRRDLHLWCKEYFDDMAKKGWMTEEAAKEDYKMHVALRSGGRAWTNYIQERAARQGASTITFGRDDNGTDDY